MGSGLTNTCPGTSTLLRRGSITHEVRAGFVEEGVRTEQGLRRCVDIGREEKTL